MAVVVTLIVAVFARDVNHAAHDATGPRRSEDLSFAALSNALVSQENEFDTHLDSLLNQAGTLPRVVFAARTMLPSLPLRPTALPPASLM